MKKVKKVASVLLAMVLLLSGIPLGMMTVNAAGYNPSAAVAFSNSHIAADIVHNSSPNGTAACKDNWQCARFVSNCLSAGGCTAFSPLVVNLRQQLINGGWGTEYLLTENGQSIYEYQNQGKLSAGDPIFFYCKKCQSFMHVVICTGFNSQGKAMASGHNARWDNVTYIAGFWDASYHKDDDILVYSFHMNESHSHSYETYYETAHPHKAYKKCSCGDWYYVDGTTESENCITCCTPEKPVLLNINEGYREGDSVTFLWNNVDNANRYDFWLYKKNGEDWDVYEHTMCVENGFNRSLPIGQYRCMLLAYNDGKWNADHSDYIYTKSDYFNFDVNPVPTKIISQPKTAYAKKGAYATTTVKASGEGLAYKWYVSDVGDTKYYLSSQKTNTYKLKMSEANHNRKAYCVVTDKYGNTTTSNVIRLRMEATITTQPTSVTAAKNAKAKFTVAASGVGLKYQWQVKTSSKAAWKNTTTTGYKTKTITVSATTARNGYQYRCVITDAAGNKVTSKAVKLTVKTPKITTQPKAVTAAKNAKAKFTVAASGVGLKYQWQVKTSSKAAWKNTTTTGYKTKTITVSATTARNGYQYRCVITDAAGNKVTSKAVKLTVKTPKITTQPTSVTAVKNAKAKFTVAASGVGLKYQWQVKTSSKAAWKNTTTTGYETKTITVSATTARNGYQYRCVITDAAGNKVTSKAVKLTVKK